MERDERSVSEVAPIQVRVRQVLSGNGEITRAETVYCPAQERSVTVRACRVCGHSQGFSERTGDELMFCDHRKAHDATLHQLLRSQAGGGDREPVRELMTTHVFCVRADVSVEALSGLLLERRISAVPVVDARGVPIGMVSKTDLVQHRYDTGQTEALDTTLEPGFHEGALAEATAAEVMVPVAITFFEDASITQVAAVMAYERVHSLPIVGQDGTVVGIVSALDLVGWYVQRGGSRVGARRRA